MIVMIYRFRSKFFSLCSLTEKQKASVANEAVATEASLKND